MTANGRTGAFLALELATLFLLSSANVAHAETLGSWTATTSYPSQLAGIGCALVVSDVYCVGGFDSNYNSYDDEYYAPVNGSGIGAWSSGPPYPTAIDSASCLGAGSTVYCVGGEEDDGETVFNDVYYSQVSPSTSQPGAWTAGATYPISVSATSCVFYDGYVYCVGGFNQNGNDVSNAYYAQVGADGVGSWTSTTSYPKLLDSASCVVVAGGYVYCVGGEIGSTSPSPVNYVYYAQLSSSGIGAWTAGPSFPGSLAGISCVSLGSGSSYVYCVGGFDSSGLSSSDAYYLSATPTGSGSWTSTTPYPLAIDTSACFVASSNIYCIGGVNGLSSGIATESDAYYASPQGITTSTTPEFPVSAVLPLILGGVLGVAAVGLRGRAARA